MGTIITKVHTSVFDNCDTESLDAPVAFANSFYQKIILSIGLIYFFENFDLRCFFNHQSHFK